MRTPSKRLLLEPISAAALCAALIACGKSSRNDYDSHGPRDASSDAPDADADSTPVNCAYPRAGTPDPAILAKVAELARPDCQYRLGPETELPFQPDWAAYALNYDVNGDEMGDIFFWEPRTSPSPSGAPLQLAVSSVTGGSLTFVRVDCEALTVIPRGRVFVRDLNGDGAPDLIVGPTSHGRPCDDEGPDVALRAFLNLPSGFVEVLRHEWPPGVVTPSTASCDIRTGLLDLEVGDFGGANDEISDIAFGYDRISPDLEVGVAVARIDALLPDQAYELDRWLGFSREVTLAPTWPIGHLAIGGAPTAPWLFIPEDRPEGPIDDDRLARGRILRSQAGGFLEQAIEFEVPPEVGLVNTFGAYHAWTVPFGSVPDALALLYGEAVALYDVSDASRKRFAPLHWFETVVQGNPGHPYGSAIGHAERFMVDVDGDGDLDFVERDLASTEDNVPDTLAVHPGETGGSFGAPFVLSASNHLDWYAESPFVRVGTANGAIVVNVGSGPYDIDGSAVGPPTFQMLECAPE